MGVSMEITFDTTAFEVEIERISARALPLAIDQGLTKWGEETMGESKGNFVPVMDGSLRNSGVVLPVARDGSTHTLTLGFGGPSVRYAVKTHENPRAGKTGGLSPSGKRYKKWAKTGGYKYLEAPMAQRGPKIPEAIANASRGM